MKLTPVANAPENNIRLRQESVKLYINKDLKGAGILYVTEE